MTGKLSQFYKDVFGCYTVGPMRDLKGDWFEKVTGIKDAAVKGEHIALPGLPRRRRTDLRNLYRMKYRMERASGAYQWLWFCACGFSGRRRRRNLRKIPSAWRNGKRRTGKSYYPSLDQTLTVVYGLDPEGNSVEILNWKPGNCE